MRAVGAVDWSDQSFNAVKVVCRLFTHEELTLIHAVDLRPFAPFFRNRLAAEALKNYGSGWLRRVNACLIKPVH